MLRGSKPGERRGGRNRGTPNRRTILRDRILAIGLEHPAASQPAFLLKLIKDHKLPPDTRMAIGPKCFPPKRRRAASREALKAVPASPEWTPQALEAFFGVVQDATVDPRARRKAAQKIAEFLLPKTAKKPKLRPDDYGFLIRPNLASAYRDTRFELRALKSGPARNIPAIAEKIKKLEARCDAILRHLEMPWPSGYDEKEAANDVARLVELRSVRDSGMVLGDAQKAEEAHLWTRYGVFHASPDQTARRRRQKLEDAERRFKAGSGPPLSRKEQNELHVLRPFYPRPTPLLSLLSDDQLEEGVDLYGYHPFVDADEVLSDDGTSYFFPRDSKLFSPAAADDLPAKTGDAPSLPSVIPCEVPANE